ncbi:hypothetical protein AKH09_10890 [Vibrio parahaemolyticus]|nr:hypothetical protein AKH09_10890 [Vibrio parahaemolyticus]
MLLVYRHDIFLRDENLPFFGQIEGHDKELLSKRVICFRMAILFVVNCVKKSTTNLFCVIIDNTTYQRSMTMDIWHYPRTELATFILNGMDKGLLQRVSIFAPRKRGKMCKN